MGEGRLLGEEVAQNHSQETKTGLSKKVSLSLSFSLSLSLSLSLCLCVCVFPVVFCFCRVKKMACSGIVICCFSFFLSSLS